MAKKPPENAAPSHNPQAAEDAEAFNCIIVGGPSDAIIVPVIEWCSEAAAERS